MHKNILNKKIRYTIFIKSKEFEILDALYKNSEFSKGELFKKMFDFFYEKQLEKYQKLNNLKD